MLLDAPAPRNRKGHPKMTDGSECRLLRRSAAKHKLTHENSAMATRREKAATRYAACHGLAANFCQKCQPSANTAKVQAASSQGMVQS